MTDPQSLLAELAALATSVAHSIVPPALADGPRAVTATALRYFNAAACSIALLDDESDELVYTAASGAGADAITGVRLPLGRGIAGWVAQSGQPLAVSDLSRDARFARDVAEATSYIPTSLLAVPIESGDRLLGVLSVLDRDETRVGAASDLEAAALFAAQSAAVIEAGLAFADAGAIVLAALARAVPAGSDLADELATAIRARRDPSLTEFATLLAELYRAGPDERRLGVSVLREVLNFVNRRGGGSSPRT